MTKIVKVGSVSIGGGSLVIMAGPCSVESEEQIEKTALAVKASGADILRGGAFKARTSPYTFQGLGEAGLEMLRNAKKLTGLPIVSEITDISELELFEDVDMIQVGARNMQNFVLLKELGKTQKPVLLKRGFGNTLEELLLSAEHIVSGGNDSIVLCERGIRSFEASTRFTLDISAVPVLKELGEFPVLVDPSHASGEARYVKPLSLAAAAAGADGLMLEVHCNPAKALSDVDQALNPEEFADIAKALRKIEPFAARYE